MSLTQYQKFQIVRMKRSALVPHPSNPRIISDAARKKLKGVIKEIGLLETVIVNKTTGFMLGGHQRVGVLDQLEHYNHETHKNDYELDVAVVELDEAQEARMLVFLNNPSGQGSWDLEKLAELVEETGEVTLESMGFDRRDVEIMFEGDARFETLFASSAEASDTKAAFEQMREDGDGAKREEGEALKAVKEERKGFNERRENKADAEFYVVVVCRDHDEKDRLMEHLNLPKGETYISPAEILAMVRK